MENASKALLIAAGVLIVILLIAFGMSIFNSTGDTSAQVATQAESTAMQTFNAQFGGYLGSGKSASAVRNLIVLINRSNTANPNHTITVPTVTPVDGTVYTVTATYDLNTGYITAFTIV